MSHVALQRVMVRMLYDPDLTARVLAEPRCALAGVDLTPVELEWLVRPDRRAWSVDGERPARALGALALRYPASIAAAVRSGAGVNDLLRFFGSAFFHRSVQERGSMAQAFAAFLGAMVGDGAIADRRVVPLARLEQSMARLLVEAPARPVPRADSGETSDPAAVWVLSPDKRLHRAAAGTADLHENIHALLRGFEGGLAAALVAASLTIPAGGVDFEHDEALLLELVRGEGWRVNHTVGASEIPEELHALLAFASSPRSRAALEEKIRLLGATPEEARGVVTDLVREGTLLPAAAAFPARAPAGR